MQSIAVATQAEAQVFSTRMSSRGQVVIPKPIRDAHAWGQNTAFVMHEHPQGLLLVPIRQAKTAGSWADLRGIATTTMGLTDAELHAPVGLGHRDEVSS